MLAQAERGPRQEREELRAREGQDATVLGGSAVRADLLKHLTGQPAWPGTAAPPGRRPGRPAPITHLRSSRVMVPRGSASTLLPQNLSFG